MQTDHYKDFTNLHKMIAKVSSATKFTGASRYHLLSTVNFPDFMYLCIGSYKINKTIKLSKKINSTESFKRIVDLKILPEPRYGLNMFQKTYPVLVLQDKLIMHLTSHELAY